MCGLNEMIARVESLSFDTKVPEIILDTDYALIQDVQGQMSTGHLSTGEDITPDYKNPGYGKYKARLNPNARGNPDARLTGEFYRNMFIELDRDNYIIGSGVEYASKLETQYGENLLRVSDKNKAEYGATYLRPRLLEYLNRVLLNG
jgi:hypothetical protein